MDLFLPSICLEGSHFSSNGSEKEVKQKKKWEAITKERTL